MAIPGVAAAQPVNECVDPDPGPGMYVCAGLDPATGVEILVATRDTKYALTYDSQGLWLCASRPSGYECIVEPE